MLPYDIAAAILFAACWLTYEPVLARIAGRTGGINLDMAPVREGWVRRMLAREVRIMDTNLLGHMLNSASFFASTNLLIIAAAAGVLFGGESMLTGITALVIVAPAPVWLLEAKIALVVVMLSRGLLDFIWAIRQLNYCLALFGAAPDWEDKARHEAFVSALTDVLNPAFDAFNKGVRSYYFALAAAAWIVSPWAMAIGAGAAYVLLMRRQTSSSAARGLRAARRLLQTETSGPGKDEGA